MNKGVQSGFNFDLNICNNVNPSSFWKFAKVNKCVDEGWKGKRKAFPLDYCIVIPDFAIVTGMGTVPLATCIDEGREAWDLVVGHPGHSIIGQGRCNLTREMGHLQIIGISRALPLECGGFIAKSRCKVKITARLPTRQLDLWCW
jgi:hypothetical protein